LVLVDVWLEIDSNEYFDGNLNLVLGLINWVMMLVYILLLEIEFNCVGLLFWFVL